MRALLFTLFALTALATSPTALAEDCGNVTEKGVCQDAKTLVYCDRGTLVTMRCPTGELCAYDEDRFNGAAGCIATRYAGCGAVPEQGLCAGSTLLYCANARIEELECPAGTTCQEDGDDADCLSAPAPGTQPESGAGDDNGSGEETPFEPGSDTDDIDNPTPVQPSTDAPLPTVQKGGAGPASDYEASGSTCQGGSASWLAALGLLLLFPRARISARASRPFRGLRRR